MLILPSFLLSFIVAFAGGYYPPLRKSSNFLLQTFAAALGKQSIHAKTLFVILSEAERRDAEGMHPWIAARNPRPSALLNAGRPRQRQGEKRAHRFNGLDVIS